MSDPGPVDPLETIRASEIGRYSYCARAWWMGRVLRLPSRNTAAMELGVREHESHGAIVATARREAALAYGLLGLALALGAALAISLCSR